ncbi:MAG: HNH endonuclease [Bernardetiaceae bacterium]|nr:HNH endonuclease [Bernardetiaceae bacterium]
MKELKLYKSNQVAIIDEQVYEALSDDKYLQSIDFLNRLRKHSEGYAVCQKSKTLKKYSYKIQTIYLHKIVAERFVEKPQSEEPLIVNIKNGDRLDCRLENLEWVTVSRVARRSRRKSSTGYRGISKEGKRYRASIYFNKKRLHIGMYATIEKALEAYNQKSMELFGEIPTMNIRPQKSVEKEAAE